MGPQPTWSLDYVRLNIIADKPYDDDNHFLICREKRPSHIMHLRLLDLSPMLYQGMLTLQYDFLDRQGLDLCYIMHFRALDLLPMPYRAVVSG
jgi:hypothetical protein